MLCRGVSSWVAASLLDNTLPRRTAQFLFVLVTGLWVRSFGLVRLTIEISHESLVPPPRLSSLVPSVF